jgi:hypothetical protein
MGAEASALALSAFAFGAAGLASPVLAQDTTYVPAERTAAAVSDPSWRAPRTAWGDPDLQGVWTTDDMLSAPRERPEQYGDRAELTDEEFQARAAQDAATAERVAESTNFRVPERGTRTFGYTSQIIAPANGRMPALTPEGAARRAAQRVVGTTNGGPFYTVEDFTLFERCITRGAIGSWGPGPYGNGAVIVQSPDSVAISYEMVHDTRIIPLDGGPAPDPAIQTWMGIPRGHWEGDSLVIETTNFLPEAPVGNLPHSDKIKLTERLTRIDPEMLDYEITVEDPEILTEPYTMRLTVTEQPGYEIYEYACQESNEAVAMTLRGERAFEREVAAARAAGLPVPERVNANATIHNAPGEGVEVTQIGAE